MTRRRAADIAKFRLTQVSRRLGTRNPVDAIGGLLDRTFELPVDDPRYGNNAFGPGNAGGAGNGFGPGNAFGPGNGAPLARPAMEVTGLHVSHNTAKFHCITRRNIQHD